MLLRSACGLGLVAALISCEVPVQIGSPVVITGSGGGTATGGSGGGSAGGGAAGGSAGGMTGGGSTGGSGGSGGAPGTCPGGQICEGVGGTAYFVCLDPNTSSGIPAGAQLCTASMPCPSGWGCFSESETSPTSACLKSCTGGVVRGIPDWVGKGAEVLATDAGVLTLSGPAGVQPADLYIAIIDADEGAGAVAVTPPPGWSQLSGWPIRNASTDHAPTVVPPSYDHTFFLYWAWAAASLTLPADFTFDRPATARGLLFAYRDVNTTTPINDKRGFGLYGDGRSNGQGSGNTMLGTARQVSIVATCSTPFPHSIDFRPSATAGETQRHYSGEQPSGLELLVIDQPIVPRLFFAPSMLFKRPPNGDTTSLSYVLATILLKPRTTP